MERWLAHVSKGGDSLKKLTANPRPGGQTAEFNNRTLKSEGSEGKGPVHVAFDGADSSASPSASCSSSWFPSLLIIPVPAWPTMFPHCDQSQPGSKHLSALPPKLGGRDGGSVRGSPSLGTPTPPPTGLLSQSPSALHTTDKRWQDSAECFLHKLGLQSLPLAGSPGTLINVKKPLAEIPASWEGGGAHCCSSSVCSGQIS